MKMSETSSHQFKYTGTSDKNGNWCYCDLCRKPVHNIKDFNFELLKIKEEKKRSNK